MFLENKSIWSVLEHCNLLFRRFSCLHLTHLTAYHPELSIISRTCVKFCALKPKTLNRQPKVNTINRFYRHLELLQRTKRQMVKIYGHLASSISFPFFALSHFYAEQHRILATPKHTETCYYGGSVSAACLYTTGISAGIPPPPLI